jgi:hypothetical protein
MTTLKIRFATTLDDESIEKLREVIEDNMGIQIITIEERGEI